VIQDLSGQVGNGGRKRPVREDASPEALLQDRTLVNAVPVIGASFGSAMPIVQPQ
jgi:hypothetical protein